MRNNSLHLAVHLLCFVCSPNGLKCLIIAYLPPISTLFVKIEFNTDLYFSFANAKRGNEVNWKEQSQSGGF